MRPGGPVLLPSFRRLKEMSRPSVGRRHIPVRVPGVIGAEGTGGTATVPRRSATPYLVTVIVILSFVLILATVPSRDTSRVGSSRVSLQVGTAAAFVDYLIHPGELCPAPDPNGSGTVSMFWATASHAPLQSITFSNESFSSVYYAATGVSSGSFAFDLSGPATPCNQVYVLAVNATSVDPTQVTFVTTFAYAEQVPLL